MPKLPPSEIFESYVKIAVDRGLIKTAEEKESKELKKYKDESYARLGSDSIETIETLYGVKPEGTYEYEDNIAEVAHPHSVIIAPSYDKINGLVENINERSEIMQNIADKRTDGKLTNYKYAKKDLILQLVKIANDMDNKDFEKLAALADGCVEKLGMKSKFLPIKELEKINKEPTPILDKFLDDGIVWVEDGEYVGKASDGTVVSLGNFHDPGIVEIYLKHNQDPSNW